MQQGLVVVYLAWRDFRVQQHVRSACAVLFLCQRWQGSNIYPHGSALRIGLPVIRVSRVEKDRGIGKVDRGTEHSLRPTETEGGNGLEIRDNGGNSLEVNQCHLPSSYLLHVKHQETPIMVESYEDLVGYNHFLLTILGSSLSLAETSKPELAVLLGFSNPSRRRLIHKKIATRNVIWIKDPQNYSGEDLFHSLLFSTCVQFPL